MKKENKPTTVDEYISDFPAETQAQLQQVRQTIQAAAPKAIEVISYGIPTFKLNKNLVHFAGYKGHIGFYLGTSGIKQFETELSNFKTLKSTIQFPLDKPLPHDLISRIVKFVVEQEQKDLK